MGEKMAKRPKPPYSDRTDLEKIQSQWTKIGGLHSDAQSSGAIVRCATAAELAANFAIRSEFTARSTLPPEVVDVFLKNANGLNGKMRFLVLPLCFAGQRNNAQYKALSVLAESINEKRNIIVHSGFFAKK